MSYSAWMSGLLNSIEGAVASGRRAILRFGATTRNSNRLESLWFRSGSGSQRSIRKRDRLESILECMYPGSIHSAISSGSEEYNVFLLRICCQLLIVYFSSFP